ncbi:hypothetical protein DFQ27_002739 [Actinomortierella ambigua]|uniref:BHLH domain-containing protein n=1 Tax=Actinomortierella ambigua TaxID=1343610 RepID=A0A9P6Q9L4_9FUNG|nr:hypothetical protein DFQ27_002739 [Actinomortierella ambigua]
MDLDHHDQDHGGGQDHDYDHDHDHDRRWNATLLTVATASVGGSVAMAHPIPSRFVPAIKHNLFAGSPVTPAGAIATFGSDGGGGVRRTGGIGGDGSDDPRDANREPPRQLSSCSDGLISERQVQVHHVHERERDAEAEKDEEEGEGEGEEEQQHQQVGAPSVAETFLSNSASNTSNSNNHNNHNNTSNGNNNNNNNSEDGSNRRTMMLTTTATTTRNHQEQQQQRQNLQQQQQQQHHQGRDARLDHLDHIKTHEGSSKWGYARAAATNANATNAVHAPLPPAVASTSSEQSPSPTNNCQMQATAAAPPTATSVDHPMPSARRDSIDHPSPTPSPQHHLHPHPHQQPPVPYSGHYSHPYPPGPPGPHNSHPDSVHAPNGAHPSPPDSSYTASSVSAAGTQKPYYHHQPPPHAGPASQQQRREYGSTPTTPHQGDHQPPAQELYHEGSVAHPNLGIGNNSASNLPAPGTTSVPAPLASQHHHHQQQQPQQPQQKQQQQQQQPLPGSHSVVANSTSPSSSSLSSSTSALHATPSTPSPPTPSPPEPFQGRPLPPIEPSHPLHSYMSNSRRGSITDPEYHASAGPNSGHTLVDSRRPSLMETSPSHYAGPSSPEHRHYPASTSSPVEPPHYVSHAPQFRQSDLAASRRESLPSIHSSAGPLGQLLAQEPQRRHSIAHSDPLGAPGGPGPHGHHHPGLKRKTSGTPLSQVHTSTALDYPPAKRRDSIPDAALHHPYHQARQPYSAPSSPPRRASIVHHGSVPTLSLQPAAEIKPHGLPHAVPGSGQSMEHGRPLFPPHQPRRPSLLSDAGASLSRRSSVADVHHHAMHQPQQDYDHRMNIDMERMHLSNGSEGPHQPPPLQGHPAPPGTHLYPGYHPGYPATDSSGQKPETPYSRSPELRISHKLAERKRRKEMKELFDELRDSLPVDRSLKTSKWEILSKAVDYISNMKAAQDDLTKEVEMLREEVQRLKADRDKNGS